MLQRHLLIDGRRRVDFRGPVYRCHSERGQQQSYQKILYVAGVVLRDLDNSIRHLGSETILQRPSYVF